MSEIKNRFGNVAGWNEIAINILGRDLEGVIEVEYDEKQEFEGVMGAGNRPVGVGAGNIESTASVTLNNEERLSLLESLPSGQRLQDLSFDMIVTYEYQNKIYTDRVKYCRFKNNGVAVKQGDKSINYKFDLFTLGIEFNV